MKLQLFALLLVVAGACAMPQANDAVVVVLVETLENNSPNQSTPTIIVENQIRQIIQRISREIRDAGLDPLVVEKEEFVYSPIPFFVEVKAFIEDLRFSGASNIRVHFLDYSFSLRRLRFDISLPELRLTVGNSGIKGSVFGNKIESEFKGSLIIQSIRLSGDIRVTMGIISGIALHNVSFNFRVGGIRSDLTLSVQDRDYSEYLNSVLNNTIPNALDKNRAEINGLLEDLVREIFDRLP